MARLILNRLRTLWLTFFTPAEPSDPFLRKLLEVRHKRDRERHPWDGF